MTWTPTIYYCFPDVETFSALEPVPGAAIDIVDPFPVTVETDEEGNVTFTGKAPEGYHVNARFVDEAPAEWAEYEIPAPNNPKRVFA